MEQGEIHRKIKFSDKGGTYQLLYKYIRLTAPPFQAEPRPSPCPGTRFFPWTLTKRHSGCMQSLYLSLEVRSHIVADPQFVECYPLFW